MTPVFSPDIIARVKDETDIVEVVRQHVNLKPAGALYKGLCPFHKEKTPSFIVTPARQRYHCFGCATGGDVISFTMEIEGVTFPEAVEILARPLDIDLSAWLKDDESEGERRAFHRANEVAMSLWRDAFWDPKLGRNALTYLKDRGFRDKVLRDFDVGWSPAGSEWLASGLQNGGVDDDLARRADLMRTSNRGGSPFAYFRSRIIFPIKNISRQVAGFGGRVIDQGEPKYLNSSDSSYFTKGKLFYGFEASRMAIAREKSAILVEGYLDLLAMVQAGIVNVVATCGTAFTVEQAKLIRRGARTVLLVFDGDKAGLKAAVRSADVALRNGLEPKIVRLPDGKDPADVVIGDGVDAIQGALKEAVGYIPFLKELADVRGGSREVKERALRQALGTIAGIEDTLRREYVLQEAADVFGMQEDLLREAVEKEAAGARRVRRAHSEPGPGRAAPGSGRDRDHDQAGGISGSDDSAAMAGKRTGPRISYSTRIDAGRIEAEMLSHVLMDDSGEAARVFLAERGELELSRTEAWTLVDEISAWAAESGAGRSPRDFVQDRWNSVADRGYRDYVSQLTSKEDRPDSTDFIKVIKDCLGTLRQAGARRGSVHTGE